MTQTSQISTSVKFCFSQKQTLRQGLESEFVWKMERMRGRGAGKGRPPVRSVSPARPGVHPTEVKAGFKQAQVHPHSQQHHSHRPRGGTGPGAHRPTVAEQCGPSARWNSTRLGKRNGALALGAMRGTSEQYAQCEQPDAKGHAVCDSACVKRPARANRQTGSSWLQGLRGGEEGSVGAHGHGFYLGWRKRIGTRQASCLHDTVNVPNATELSTLKG